MATSAIVGPGLLMGSFALIIIVGLVVALIEKRLEPKREH